MNRSLGAPFYLFKMMCRSTMMSIRCACRFAVEALKAAQEVKKTDTNIRWIASDVKTSIYSSVHTLPSTRDLNQCLYSNWLNRLDQVSTRSEPSKFSTPLINFRKIITSTYSDDTLLLDHRNRFPLWDDNWCSGFIIIAFAVVVISSEEISSTRQKSWET